MMLSILGTDSNCMWMNEFKKLATNNNISDACISTEYLNY